MSLALVQRGWPDRGWPDRAWPSNPLTVPDVADIPIYLSVDGIQRVTERTVAVVRNAQVGIPLGSIAISDQSPMTARFRAQGFTPDHGEEVVAQIGGVSRRLFGGQILSTDMSFLSETLEYPITDVSAIEYSWVLATLVLTRYEDQSATAIAIHLVQTYMPGFTYGGIATGLPTVDLIDFDNVYPLEALKQLAIMIGAAPPYVDEYRNVHLFLDTETIGTPVAITSANLTVKDIVVSRDISQVVTRVFSRWVGSKAKYAASPGDGSLQLETTSNARPDGGTVIVGPQRICYNSAVEIPFPIPVVVTSFNLLQDVTFSTGGVDQLDDPELRWMWGFRYTEEGTRTLLTGGFGSTAQNGKTAFVYFSAYSDDPRVTAVQVFRMGSDGYWRAIQTESNPTFRGQRFYEDGNGLAYIDSLPRLVQDPIPASQVFLLGIALSGPGSIQYPIAAGDVVTNVLMIDDMDAQEYLESFLAS